MNPLFAAGLRAPTPGPVVAEWLRLSAVAIALALAAVTVCLAAGRWSRSRPGAMTVVGWVATGAVAAYVAIGLHEQTPGPVLDAGLRWATVAALSTGVASGAGEHGRVGDRLRSPDRDHHPSCGAPCPRGWSRGRSSGSAARVPGVVPSKLRGEDVAVTD